MAANSLGVSSASAYLKIVDTLEESLPVVVSQAYSSNLIYALTSSLLVFFVVAILIIFVTVRNLRNEKMKHRAMERVNQWTKKVIVVQPTIDNGSSGLSDTLVSVLS